MSVILSFFSISFSIMYLFCGITDMVDGTIARKTKSMSEFGARLDTVADSVFVAVCFVKILPLMQFPIRTIMSKINKKTEILKIEVIEDE